MGLRDALHSMAKSLTKAGTVNGADFPKGTYINFSKDEGENVMLFTYPNKDEETIRHDMVKCATVLAMGVIDIEQGNGGKATVLHYGTKYLCVLKDGRQAVLTVGLGESQNGVERVLF